MNKSNVQHFYGHSVEVSKVSKLVKCEFIQRINAEKAPNALHTFVRSEKKNCLK